MLPAHGTAHPPALATRAPPVTTQRAVAAIAAATPTPTARHTWHGTQVTARSPALTSVATPPPAASPAGRTTSAK